MIEQISVFPPFDEKERKLNPSYRFHCIQRLFQYFQPFEKHLDLEQRISRAIRQGYLHRNPMKKEEIMRVHESYKAIKEGKFIKIIKQKPNGQQQGSPLSVYLVLENRPQSRGSCPFIRKSSSIKNTKEDHFSLHRYAGSSSIVRSMVR